MEKNRIKLILEPISKRIFVTKDSTVYEALLAWNFPMGALCAGNGTCGKCLIRVLDANPQISNPSEKEKIILGKQKLLDGFQAFLRDPIRFS